MDDEIRTRLGWQERTIELPPGRYDTVLPPSAVADLLVYYFLSSDARSAYEGRSVFSRPGGGIRISEALTSRPLTLRSDPRLPGLESADRVLASSSSPMASVFDNGLPCPPAVWLDAGRVAALPTTRHTAALTGLPVVPPVGNLILQAPEGSGRALDLVTGLDRGLLLTSLWYIREVDPQTLLLTGLTRDGVYVVEGGEVIGAGTNFRFNESPVDLLTRVEAVGGTEITLGRELGDWFTRTAMPALRVSGYNMSTASEAS
jgi:predicted Zn-dependent protease